MSNRAKWVGLGLVAFLPSGCETCRGWSGKQADTPSNRCFDSPSRPAESNIPQPGNAFASLAENEFKFPTGHLIWMPVPSTLPDTKPYAEQ